MELKAAPATISTSMVTPVSSNTPGLAFGVSFQWAANRGGRLPT
jgi:hypothetical protein